MPYGLISVRHFYYNPTTSANMNYSEVSEIRFKAAKAEVRYVHFISDKYLTNCFLVS